MYHSLRDNRFVVYLLKNDKHLLHGAEYDGYKTYIHCLQVAITTPEGGSRGYPYI